MWEGEKKKKKRSVRGIIPSPSSVTDAISNYSSADSIPLPLSIFSVAKPTNPLFVSLRSTFQAFFFAS